MEPEWIILICISALALIVLVTSYVCFRMTFYSRRSKSSSTEIKLPEDEVYKNHKEEILRWVEEVDNTECLDVETKSFDGLTLRGKYYESFPGAPIEILMHGYRGNARRDMSGGVFRSRDCGHNALVIDQRASGRSEGKVITFGINESRDCLAWIEYIRSNIDKDAKIILGGVSMGAATVMIASGMELPENIIAVLADCGYTSPKAIIKKVIRDMKLPPDVFYPFVKLGGLIFGHFNVDEFSPIEMVKKNKLPIIFFHGGADDYVPTEMSREIYEASPSVCKRFVIIDGAAHGLAYPENKELYVECAREFFKEVEK